METATVHSSQLATAGSTMGGMEQSTEAVRTSSNRNHLRNYLLDLSTWTHMLIFSTFCQQSASRYVDSEGTYVRKLSLANYPYQLRAALGSHDPVIVLVDSEIEQAILAMAGDLSKVREVYPSENGIDWVKFQYHSLH